MITLIEAIVALVAGLLTGFAVFTKHGREAARWLRRNLISGSADVGAELATDLAPGLAKLLRTLITVVEKTSPGLESQLEPVFEDLAVKNYAKIFDALKAHGFSEPANADLMAALAIGQAFGFGAKSGGITALFESLFPEKLNALNAAGPLFAEMAGFKEVAGAVRDPLYDAAFGQSLKYKYEGIFKPKLPQESDAVEWHSRGLLTDEQLKTVFGYSGLKTEYEQPFIKSAYRAVSPFIIARGMQSGVLTASDLNDVMTFEGLRPVDRERLLKLFADMAIMPYRRAALNAFIAAAVNGLYTGSGVDAEIANFQLPAGASDWIKKEIAYKRLEKLSALYEKEVSNAYKYSTITDADYVPTLENIGLGEDFAAARYGVDSTVKHGKSAIAALAAEARLEARRKAAQVKTVQEQFITGTIDAAALTAQYLALGVDPQIAAASIEFLTARKQASQLYVYGIAVTKPQGELLKQKVESVKTDVRKGLVKIEFARATLKSFGIGDDWIEAMVSTWAAAYAKSLLPP